MRTDVAARARRLAARVAAALVLGAPLIAVAAPAHAAATITRYSGNQCATARFVYGYTPEPGGTYEIFWDGTLTWDESRSTCGPFREPYAGVLQWSGYRNGVYFGWQTAPNGHMDYYNPKHIAWAEPGGMNDIRFRVCNTNVRTGYVGTCGSW
ncbi:hypothetical protein [Bailinhaonella thermotolerans]|uniref:hypothetical protein n=1 Tax=Bailinhaonella thermotolerans TaxID=1070861 RepID=UPI0011C37F99|nr:hypothetical protein [Bailinhaonella thermotolerans]